MVVIRLGGKADFVIKAAKNPAVQTVALFGVKSGIKAAKSPRVRRAAISVGKNAAGRLSVKNRRRVSGAVSSARRIAGSDTGRAVYAHVKKEFDYAVRDPEFSAIATRAYNAGISGNKVALKSATKDAGLFLGNQMLKGL